METIFFFGGLLCAFLFPILLVVSIGKAVKGEDHSNFTFFSGITFAIVILAVFIVR